MYVSNEREKAICHMVSQGLLSEIVGITQWTLFSFNEMQVSRLGILQFSLTCTWNR